MKKLPSYFLIVIFLLLRPLFGVAQCCYAISCGRFTIEQLKTQPLLPALWAITKRVLSCHPWTTITPEDHFLNRF